ncbi:MAG TPA: hypothetical protein VFT74_04325 [Isosphaeraceae bacterium]|nr:hypothetical protein [Isosphaeraceae bacterium]
MSVVNSKKPSASTTTATQNWAGAAARIRRGGSSRMGRRSALLGVLTSMYANSSRGGSNPTPAQPASAGQGSDRS